MATFKEAFRSARNAGKKVFTWNGKSYNTKLKEETAPKKAATPTEKPSRGTKSGNTSKKRNAKPAPKEKPKEEPKGYSGSPTRRVPKKTGPGAAAVGIARKDSPIARKAALIRRKNLHGKGR